MSLNPPRQPSGSPALPDRPDPEALLIEAVRQRRRQESLDFIQRCVHRKGLDWLHRFQTLTLPALEGHEAALWLEALLGDGSAQVAPGSGAPLVSLPGASDTSPWNTPMPFADPSGLEREQAWIEQRATAAVDGAIASMLAEFPDLVVPAPPLDFVLPLAAAPAAPAVPEVLPARTPPPVFSFAAGPAITPRETACPPFEAFPEDTSEESGKESPHHLESSVSEPFSADPPRFDRLTADSVAPLQRSAAAIGAAVRSRLRRRLSRTDWRNLARLHPDHGVAAQDIEPPDSPGLEPPALEEIQEPVVSPCPAGPEVVPLQDPAGGGVSIASPPDPLAVVVRLAERQRGLPTLQEAAPAPSALADLRAWLPDASLPRAS